MNINRLEQLLNLGITADVDRVPNGWAVRTVIPEPCLSHLVPEFVELVLEAAIMSQE